MLILKTSSFRNEDGRVNPPATEPPLYVNIYNACVCAYKLKSFNLCMHTHAYIYFTRYRWLGGRRVDKRELRFMQMAERVDKR